MAQPESPFESLYHDIITSKKIHAIKENDVWVYGIIVGWTDSDFKQLQEMHKWTDARIARLKRLHERYVKLTAAAKGYVEAFAKGFGKEKGNMTGPLEDSQKTRGYYHCD